MGEQEPAGKPFAISKQEVWDAWLKVRANKGAPGADGQSIEDFQADLKNNLYKVWNRMSSGSYFPPPVKAVEIPKPHGGGTRILGVPTVADRVAQTVAAARLEKVAEPKFHDDSYGYRPRRSALDAVGKCRERCWKNDWAIDLDIQKFFDSVPWDMIVKAVQANTTDAWVILYVKRWLAAPLQMPDGSIAPRDRGTPQGSAVSPVLANLFLHYAFDCWMARKFPAVPFERYVDDAVVHCRSERQARMIAEAIGERMEQVGLALHPQKTRIVYCQDGNRRGSAEHVSFTYLGFMFRARGLRTRHGKVFTGFAPAISKEALKKISAEVRSWRLHRHITYTLGELARWISPIVRGSPGVPSVSHDVAPVALRRAFATHLQGCGARCRCCSDARRLRTGCFVQHLWRDYPILINRWPAGTVTTSSSSWYGTPEKRGWMQYYGAFYRSALYPVLKRINGYLVRWLRKKYRRLRLFAKAHAAWGRLTSQYPGYFAHWQWATGHWRYG